MTHQDLYTLCALVLGLLVGSFLNVVVYRMPLSLFGQWRAQAHEYLELADTKGEEEAERFNVAFPASHCPVCKAPIKPWHNIPLISYFFLLKGKCQSCGVKISLRYPIVELVTGVISAYVVYRFGASLEAILALILCWTLIVLTLIDADHHILPDDLTLPLLWLGLLANVGETFTTLSSSVIGAAGGYLFLWSVYWAFKLLTKKEGMGYGDFKLLAALGAWMGWQSLGMIILLSSLVGAVIGIAGIVVFGKDKNKPIPFGPYLAIAGMLSFFFGEQLKNFYFGALGLGG